MPSLLFVRDPLADAKDTLSSWDKCMSKTYCKWPVIVAIIVGGLIILSVVLCIARCVCCGAEIACCCFKCCSCCCPSGGRSGHKRVKSEPTPSAYPPSSYQPSAYSSAPPAPSSVDTRPLNQQYRSHAAPSIASAPAAAPEKPQFAFFETPSKPVNEDALPAMPSWNDAKSHHVEEEVIPEKRDDMEMDRLNHNGSVAGSSMASGGMAAAAIPGAARRSPGPRRSPVQRMQTQDSYGYNSGYQNDSFVSAAPQRSPHNSPGPYGRPHGQQQDGYRGISPVHTLSPVYGAGAVPGYGQNQDQQYDRRSPGPAHNQYRRPSPGPAHMESPVSAHGYGYDTPEAEPLNMPQHETYHDNAYSQPPPAMMASPPYAQAPPARVASPAYAPSGSTRYELAAPAAAPTATPAYPGQETYSAEPAYPGQQSYQAYVPGQQR